MARSPVLYDHTGKEIDHTGDGMSLGHIMTFGSLIQGGYHTYFHREWDEALKHRRENALAMRRDCWLESLMEERYAAILGRKWHLEPDNPKDATQKAVADGLTKILRAIPRFNRLRKYLARSIFQGRYAAQLKYQWQVIDLPAIEYSGPIVPGVTPQTTFRPTRVLQVQRHEPVNGDKLGWHVDGTPYVLVNATFKAPGAEIIYSTEAPGLLLRGTWRQRFCIADHNPEDADYYEAEAGAGKFGIGVRSRVYWLNWLRENYLAWISDTFERIGLGIVVIYYEAGNPTAKEEALATAKNYSRRSAIVIPRSPDANWSGGAIEIIESPTGGITAVRSLVDDIERKIERYIVGQHMSSGADGEDGLGGTGRSKLAESTKNLMIDADAEELAESITGSIGEPGIVSTIKRWTYPWADFPVRMVCEENEVEPEQRLQSIKTAWDMGAVVAAKDVRQAAGLRTPEDGEEVLSGGVEAGKPPGMPGKSEEGDEPGAGDGDGSGKGKEEPSELDKVFGRFQSE